MALLLNTVHQKHVDFSRCLRCFVLFYFLVNSIVNVTQMRTLTMISESRNCGGKKHVCSFFPSPT